MTMAALEQVCNEIEKKGIRMSLAVIDYHRCDPGKCDHGICIVVKVCPARTIEQEASGEIPFISGGCYACNKCVKACPLDAIMLV